MSSTDKNAHIGGWLWPILCKPAAPVFAVLSFAICALTAPVATAIAAPKCPPCMDGKLLVLQEGGFSGLLLCDGPDSEFRFLGKIEGRKQSYAVYYYQFFFMAASTMHGGERLVVFDARGKYLGQYELPHGEGPTFWSLAGRSVHWRIEDQAGDIDFTDGPPPSTLIFHDIEELFK